MNLSPATLQKAREAGYSDDEILSHVSTADEKIGNAVKAGYSLDEVATHFDEKARFRALEPTTGFTDEERGQAEREAMLEYVREAKPRIPGNIDLGSTDPEFTGTGVAAEPVGGETGLVKPLLSAIGVEGPEGDTTGAGLVRGGISLADSLTTPTNIALMESMVGAPRVIAKAAGAAFLPMMVSGTREGAIAFNRAETPRQAAEAAVGAVGSAAMGALGTFHSGTRAPDVSLDARFLRSLAPMPRLLAESGAPLTAAEVARFEPIPETTVPGMTAQESNPAMPTEAASRSPVEFPAPTTTPKADATEAGAATATRAPAVRDATKPKPDQQSPSPLSKSPQQERALSNREQPPESLPRNPSKPAVDAPQPLSELTQNNQGSSSVSQPNSTQVRDASKPEQMTPEEFHDIEIKRRSVVTLPTIKDVLQKNPKPSGASERKAWSEKLTQKLAAALSDRADIPADWMSNYPIYRDDVIALGYLKKGDKYVYRSGRGERVATPNVFKLPERKYYETLSLDDLKRLRDDGNTSFERGQIEDWRQSDMDEMVASTKNNALSTQIYALKNAMENRQPVSAKLADAVEMPMESSGYTREGDLYVYRPDKLSEPPAEAQTTPPAAPATAPPAAREVTGASASEKTAAADAAVKQESLPKQLRTDSDIASVLAGEETGPQMRMGEAPEGGAFGSAGGSRPKVRPAGNTPLGDSEFIRIPSAMQRFGRGLLTEGSADVMAKQRNKVGQMLSRAIRKHVDLEQEISGSMMAEFNQAMRGLSKTAANRALDEITPYLAAKENGRPTPTLSPAAQKILTAWENIAETTGLMAEAHNVQVFDPSTGGHRPMHRMGRSYVPRMFTKEVTRVLQDPASNPTLFNDLADALAVHRGISQADAATLLRQEAGRFQTSDFIGSLEMARTGQLPESFYEYDLRNLASQYLPSFSERMAQIIAYGQRLGPRDTPNRKNLWDVARSEAEDRYSQQWLRDAEDQAVNLRPNSGVMQGTRRLQTLASGLLLSSPTTSVVRNTLSGLSASTELMGVRRSVSNLVKAATDAQTKMDAKEIGAVRDNIGDFLYADQLGDSALDDMVRGVTDVALKYSGYNGSETFVRTHAAATASQFAKDGITAIAKDPSSMRSKEALGLFKRLGVDAKEIVAEGADWKTGPETRKFIRAIIRDSQGGYRFDQVPLWANSAVGRFLYQFGRYGTQRARNIWRNGIQPLIGEDVEWNGKTMTRRDARPLMKMGASAILLGETFALLASGFLGRDRKDASLEEIAQAMTEDQKLAAAMAGERLINDIIMAGTLGIWGQPLDAIKSLKDQSRFKNPFEPPGLSSTKSVIRLATNAMDQGGRVTLRDINDFLGGTAPGIKQAGDVVRNVFDEPLYEAENDVRTLRAAAKRWAMDTKQDVSRRASTAYRKSKNAPEYMAIQEALLVGDSQRAKFLAGKFLATQPDQAKARKALSASIKARQPFRVGPYTSAEHRADFMEWAKTRLPKKDYEQAKRVQDRYEAAAKNAGF